MTVSVIETIREEYIFNERDLPDDIIISLKSGQQDAFMEWFNGLDSGECEDSRGFTEFVSSQLIVMNETSPPNHP